MQNFFLRILLMDSSQLVNTVSEASHSAVLSIHTSKHLRTRETSCQSHPSQSLVSTSQTDIPTPVMLRPPASQPSCVCGDGCLLFEPSREARRTGTALPTVPTNSPFLLVLHRSHLQSSRRTQRQLSTTLPHTNDVPLRDSSTPYFDCMCLHTVPLLHVGTITLKK